MLRRIVACDDPALQEMKFGPLRKQAGRQFSVHGPQDGLSAARPLKAMLRLTHSIAQRFTYRDLILAKSQSNRDYR